MRSIIPLLSLLLIFFSTHAAAQSYKYIDENGTVHFTDNPYLIPESEKSKTQIYEDKEHAPSLVIENEKEASPPVVENSKPLSTPQDPLLKAEYDLLEKEKQTLIKKFSALQQKKEGFRELTEKITSLSKAKKVERKKIGKALNEQIEEYNKNQAAFNQKVETFNAKVNTASGNNPKSSQSPNEK